MVSEKTNGAWLNSATHDSMTEAATTSATVDAMSVRATLRLACGSVPSAVAVADRGYFSSEEILACEKAGITVTLPKPMTSNSKAAGRFGKQDFRYVAEADVYMLSLIHISEPTRQAEISYAVFC